MLCRRDVSLINAACVCLIFGTTNLSLSAAENAHSNKKVPPPDVQHELAKIRRNADEMRDRWVKDEENWRKLPARAWPERQPDSSEIPSLEKQCSELCSGKEGSESSEACRDVTFYLATALLFNNVNAEKGMELFESLARRGDVRGTTAAGICFVEGFGVGSDEERGSKMIQEAANREFPQGVYELGVLHYNGNAAPFVTEDVKEAFRLFEKSAQQQHTSGLYMTADMLLSGEGCENKDVARAIGLLYAAGERGHRNARATLWALLREYE